ncbi:MAG: periplasmic heavy metal sensor [Deltaproteobacteria bacterium]|nr:periplasmic heavy metal sensor [Deltaproteobacteria bacterium]
MKRGLFIALFAFSVALNIAVAGTLAWHLWLSDRSPAAAAAVQGPLTESDFRTIRGMWKSDGPRQLMEKRQVVLQKKADLLDLIAEKPQDPKAADKALDELNALKAEEERMAAERIRQIMQGLPEEKRAAFLTFLKDRACPMMGPGMGWKRQMMGQGPGWRGGQCICPVHPAGVPKPAE